MMHSGQGGLDDITSSDMNGSATYILDLRINTQGSRIASDASWTLWISSNLKLIF